MSKAIVAVAKTERRRLMALLKPVEATIARFGGTTKRQRKSAGRKATAAPAPKAGKTGKPTKKTLTEAEQLRAELRADKGKK